MAEWDTYFERIKSIGKGKLYDTYSDALEEFDDLANRMTEDFCFPMAIAGKNENGRQQFKILAKEEEGWNVFMCNAIFAFGEAPCIVKIVE